VDVAETADGWMIYGANGYTGELIAREAARRGLRPTLAGRSAAAIVPLAEDLGLDHRVVALEDARALDDAVGAARVVLHCAGPFARTSRPMVEACLRRRVHYLDITGEVEVFEACAARTAEARAAGVTLLPGTGFDVVPSDCLAAHLKSRLPTATHLALGFQVGASVSRGTATTTAENLHRGGLVRKDGVLTRVPPGFKARVIDFGRGPRPAVTIPWGDVATAFHSTGIPNVEVYMAAPAEMRVMLKFARVAGPLLGTPPLQRLLKAAIRRGPRGPSADQRTTKRSYLWGEARDGERTVVSRLAAPETYALTVQTALAAVTKVRAGLARPGFQTPSLAFGKDFILEIEGVTRIDD
jgi:short subunit dehydrogenase-like uncharacterized protein